MIYVPLSCAFCYFSNYYSFTFSLLKWLHIKNSLLLAEVSMR